jgi:hypothetical protein
MRLTKTLYIIKEEESAEPIYYNDFGEPVYGVIETKTPFQAEIEPYSNTLANNRYGVSVDVTNRLFCKPNPDILLGTLIEYNNIKYSVTENMQYDRHFEVLMKKS